MNTSIESRVISQTNIGNEKKMHTDTRNLMKKKEIDGTKKIT